MRRGLVVVAVALASAFPASADAGSVFLVRGGGWGHGVGMSQWGAEGAALHGWSYERILAHFYPGTTLQVWPARPVRVLLAEDEPRVAIGSAAPFLVVDARGRKVHVRPRTLRLGVKLRLGGRVLAPPVRIVPGAQPLTLGGVGYRGELVLRRDSGALAVVNRIRLDLYLRGVVPYEMPIAWQAAAYEAQAVVARTYALATMHPGAAYDLFADDRSQVYGGIPAERPETSLALGATAGRVLTYGGRPIVAYYHSSSGGRTEAVQDAWPGQAPEPYLVSVTDPFDSLSPHHRWQAVLRPDGLSRRFHVPVTDLRVEHDAGGRATRVLLVGPRRTKRIDAIAFRRALGLRSTYFAVQVLSLDPPAGVAVFGRPLALRGFLRGVAGVVLQQRTPAGSWQQAERVRTRRDGRFELAIRPRFSTAYRLAVDGNAGSPVDVAVARQIDVRADGDAIAGTVVPAAPVRIERRTGAGWKQVAQIPVGPSGFFRAELGRQGQYRAAAGESGRYLASASRPVRVAR
jgi:stage II sporulation protein D